MPAADSLLHATFARELGRTLLESELAAAVAIDGDGRILGWSDGAEAILGHRRADVLGRDLAIVLLDRPRSPHRDRLAPRSLVPGSGHRRFEQMVRRADGSAFTAEVTILATPGEEAPYIALVQDITERRARQSRLVRSEALMAKTEELARRGSFDHDLRTGDLEWSAGMYRVFGLAPEGPPPPLERLSELVHPLDRDAARARIEEVLHERPAAFEQTFRVGEIDGQERVVALRGTLVADEFGQPARLVGTARDITEEWPSHRSRDLLSYVVQSSDDAILTQRPDGTITSWNAGAERLYGYSAGEAIGQPVSMLAPSHLADEQADLNRRVFAGESIRHQEAERVRKDGSRMLVSLTISPVRDPTGRIISAAVAGRDVTHRRRLERRLRHLADHDPLTGLFNRRRFEQELHRELSRTARHGGGGAVLSIDLDEFKQVNDTGGHAAGDALLGEVADTLRRTLRESDVPARMGGDEFAVLLPGTSAAEARTVGEHLLASLREVRVDIGGIPFHPTASIGGVGFTGSETDGDELVVAADLAMYAAKEQGRNRVVVLAGDAVKRPGAALHVSWARRIRDALEHDGLVLHAQPIVALSTGAIAHHELLLRMRQDGGLIEPAAFLGAAERLGLIHAIDRWVVRRAIELLADDRAPSGAPLSLNLSGASVAGDAGLLGLIRAELAAHHVDPAMLIFELAETAAVTSLAQARRFAAGVRELGCRVALDDFGAGFGSFLYLKHLPVDLIKIDREFVLDLAASDVDRRLVRSIADVARGLGVETVAEGVSDARTLELLREMDVQYAQGFHLGPPAPVA